MTLRAVGVGLVVLFGGCDGPGCDRDGCGKQACSCFDYLENPQDKVVGVCVSTSEFDGTTSYSLDDEDGEEVFSCEESSITPGDCSLQLMESVIATCES